MKTTVVKSLFAVAITDWYCFNFSKQSHLQAFLCPQQTIIMASPPAGGQP